MHYCPQCGERSTFSDGEVTTLGCPGCGDHHCTSSLVERQVGDERLSECLACHGVWLSTHTVDAITTDASARALFAPDAAQGSLLDAPSRGAWRGAASRNTAGDDPSDKFADAGAAPAKNTRRTVPKNAATFRYRRCPVCATMMSRVNVAKISGVIVDRCPDHGTFFDVDELHALVRFLEQGGLDRARAREREALVEERRRLQMLMDMDARRRSADYARVEGVPATSITALLGALLRRAGE